MAQVRTSFVVFRVFNYFFALCDQLFGTALNIIFVSLFDEVFFFVRSLRPARFVVKHVALQKKHCHGYAPLDVTTVLSQGNQIKRGNMSIKFVCGHGLQTLQSFFWSHGAQILLPCHYNLAKHVWLKLQAGFAGGIRGTKFCIFGINTCEI